MRFIHVIMDLIPVLRTKAGNMLTRTCQYLENIINKLSTLSPQSGIDVKTKEYFLALVLLLMKTSLPLEQERIALGACPLHRLVSCTLDSNTLAQVARINFYRLDLNSFLQNIFKNVFGLSVGALEIVLLIFLDILSRS